MEIQRTANAGILLKLDGVSILLDGLCDRIEPYVETPAYMAQALQNDPPDLLVFTHSHGDHCSQSLVSAFQKQNLRPILGPESLPYGTEHRKVKVGSVTVTPIPSRHIGKYDITHYSYLIEGSRKIFFAGDAAPLQWKGKEIALDVLIAPFAYANTKPAWQWSCSVASQIVIVHLPEKENDPVNLWQQVENATEGEYRSRLLTPRIGEILTL